MTDKELETIMEQIQGSCATMRIRGEDMISQLNDLAEKLSRCLPAGFAYRHGCIEFRQEFLSTRQGSYGAALCYCADEDSRSRPVPEEWKAAGKSYYFLNEYHHEIWQANRIQIAKVAKALPDFLGELVDYLNGTNGLLQDSIDVLKKMLKQGEQNNEA